MSNYNSVENYTKLFSDIVCEVGDSDCSDETIANIFAGFENAIIELMSYHDDALKRFRKLHGAFMRGRLEKILDILDEHEYRYHVLPHGGMVNDWYLAYVELARAINDYLELNIIDSYEVP